MDLSTLTSDQRSSVMRVSGPLLISAGAGSGKTFTLTQRIAYALSEGTNSGVNDIDEVLAITFTDKAAGEIKERVKSTLRLEGMHDQALKVDAAWISTIHGMCSRILRAHALEIGIDPGFDVISDMTKNELIAEAIDEALGADNRILSKTKYPHLFNEFKSSQIASMLDRMLEKAANLKSGLHDVKAGPIPCSSHRIARNLLLVFEDLMPVLEQAGSTKSAETARERTTEAIATLKVFLEEPEHKSSLNNLAKLMNSFFFVPKRFGNADVKAAIGEYQQEHARSINEVVFALAQPALNELISLAGEVQAIYEKRKKERFVFDNDDLLLKTLSAFEEHPEITTQYAEQFKLVMVDEFQDTSQIQIEIVNYLAGENAKNLCTVGDYQQSIYRFRGADVNVYEAHKEEMRSERVGARAVELSKNFRSHKDVLSFVERIFSQSHVFGTKFMGLNADESRPSEFKLGAPRIDLILAMRPAGNNTGVSIKDAKYSEAQAIAERFTAFKKAGHDARDMVVLLGRMSNAHIYAQALRDAGFECVITGGSLFSKAPEVRVIARLAEVLANGMNSAALFEVLSSELFCLSADDFIELSTYQEPETGILHRYDLSKGFVRLVERVKHGEVLSAGLMHAVSVLSKAWKLIGTESLSQVIKQVLEDSGWLTRLQRGGATGIAVAGNLCKAQRIIHGLEAENSLGISSVARDFSEMLEVGIKEAPGALTGKDDSVVKIMTIHASKGLEFPLVALADFYGMNSRSDKLILETCNNKTFSSLNLGMSLEEYPELKRRMNDYQPFIENEKTIVAAAKLEATEDLAEYRAALKCFAAHEELAEARRKFYVGLTRASEALIVSMTAKNSSRDPLTVYKDIIEDIRSALCGDQDFPQEQGQLEYGGTRAASFERIAVPPHAFSPEHNKRAASELSDFIVPVIKPIAPMRDEVSISPSREAVFSYSSLSSREKATGENVSRDTPEGKKSKELLLDADKATDLGSAFHRLAQYGIEAGMLPSTERIRAISTMHQLSSEQRQRLSAACELWFSSREFEQTNVYSKQSAEVPFFVEIGDQWMEGEIDLLCTQKNKDQALIIDYKTGGSASEDESALVEKHLLQASCYAYAILKQGFSEVELRFVRVEVEDPVRPGEPQVVSYRFTSKETRALRRMILDLYLRSRS